MAVWGKVDGSFTCFVLYYRIFTSGLALCIGRIQPDIVVRSDGLNIAACNESKQ